MPALTNFRTRSETLAGPTLALMVALLAATLLLSCRGEQRELRLAPVRHVIISLDGRATLLIPGGALPDGVAPRDLTLEVIADPALVFSPGRTAPLAAYRLLPAGIELREPVRLTLRVPFEQASEGLYAFHVSGDEIEPVADIELETNPETDTVAASIQLSRFDEVYWWRFGLFSVRFQTTYLEVPLGDSFTVIATVDRGPEPTISGRHEPSGATFDVSASDEPWTLSGTFFAGQPVAEVLVHLTADVSPTLVRDLPPPTSVSTDTFTVEQRFECQRETGSRTGRGGARVWYEAVISFPEAFQVTSTQRGRENRPDLQTVTARTLTVLHLDCVPPGIPLSEPPPTESAPD